MHLDKWIFYTKALNLHPLISASVPSTVAQFYQEQNLEFVKFSDHTYFYTHELHIKPGDYLLQFQGLAGLVEVYLNNELLFVSNSMFVEHSVEVTLQSFNAILLKFLPQSAHPIKKLSRARWRQQLVDEPALRGTRSTLLGHMPGWCPSVDAVGPYRPVLLHALQGNTRFLDPRVEARSTSNASNDYCVVLSSRVIGDIPHPVYFIEIGKDVSLYMEIIEELLSADSNLVWNTVVLVKKLLNQHLWFPHTHGNPVLHNVFIQNGVTDQVYPAGKIGFRRIEIDRLNDRFQLIINSVPVFCRGAVWNTTDLISLSSSREHILPLLVKMKNAGMNIVRVSGTMLYEGSDFYDLCDELGIMVWQDFQFSNFDYPVDDDFISLVSIEITQFLQRTSHNACITVLCGGSEVYQQAAMLGLPPERYNHKLFDSVIKQLCEKYRPDAIYVPNSPYGGDVPFCTNKGVTHYYGVPAYLRELSDVRRSDVKFASECLAISNVCSSNSLTLSPPLNHKDWKAGIPRDSGVSWDFEDVRDHYLEQFYNINSNLLRRQDSDRYLELSRATTYHLFTAVYSEWRSKASQCAGGIVYQLRDVMQGSGWGIVDVAGVEKSSYYAMSNTCQSEQVIITDEGLNGLAIRIINETSKSNQYSLFLSCVKGDRTIIRILKENITVDAHSEYDTSSTSLIGKFFDITHAYKFGPLLHEAVLVHLIRDDQLISQASYYPGGYALQQYNGNITAELTQSKDTLKWSIKVTTLNFAHLIHFDIPGYRVDSQWIDMLPNSYRIFALLQEDLACVEPQGHMLVLNYTHPIQVKVTK